MTHRIAILMAEDEQPIRMLAAEALEDAGCIVSEASDAKSALDVLNANAEDIQVLFTDINMPGSMNGLEWAQYVRSVWPHIALLVASGQVNPIPSEMPPGCRFLRKPYDLEAVIEQIRVLAAA